MARLVDAGLGLGWVQRRAVELIKGKEQLR